MSNLVLGTVQLGMDYGISNKNGKPSLETSFKILDAAVQSGIEYLDTASSYGDSESVIGAYSVKSNNRFKVITKISPKTGSYEEMLELFGKSLKNIGENSLYGILIHNYNFFNQNKENVIKFFEEIKEKYNVSVTGLSLYHPEECCKVMDFDIIEAFQFPFNLFDHRFANSELLSFFVEKKKEIFIRSVYLQGLFMLNEIDVRKKIPIALPYIEKLHLFCEENSINVKELAWGFVKLNFPGAKIVIGADSPDQVIDNLKTANYTISESLNKKILEDFSNIPSEVILPYLWNVN